MFIYLLKMKQLQTMEKDTKSIVNGMLQAREIMEQYQLEQIV